MTTRAVRRVVVAVCVLGIAGMIAASVADSTGAALTFGLITTTAVVMLVVATAVTAPAAAIGESERAPDDAVAARVEELVTELVAGGASEEDVRALVREAVRLGRTTRR